jgi:photosystem II stability/assembly factor-like uncharacterized protein
MRLVAATSRGVEVMDAQSVRSTLNEDVRSLAGTAPLYAGTQGRGVFRSDDDGETWQPAGLSEAIVKALAVAADGTVYAGTKPPGLHVSRDGGLSWRELESLAAMRRWYWWQPAEKPHTPYVDSLAVSPSDPRVLLAGIEAGRILRSEDGGQTWRRHRRGVAADCHALVFHPRDGAYAYEAAGFGAAFSRDGGKSWSRVTAGLEGRYAMTVAADPEEADRWYIATAGMRRAHTTDARAVLYRGRVGERWECVLDGLGHLPRALVATREALYAGLGSGEILLSPDRGDSWERLSVSFDGLRALLVLDPTGVLPDAFP